MSFLCNYTIISASGHRPQIGCDPLKVARRDYSFVYFVELTIRQPTRKRNIYIM